MMQVTVDPKEAKKIEAFIQKASAAGYSEDEIKAAIERKYPQSAPQSPPISIDPTEGMSTTEKLLAGVGKAFVGTGRGVGQLAGDVAEGVGMDRPSWAPTKADIEEVRRRDAPLMKTGAGVTGNVLGNIASFAPLALIPGANTIAGGATIGALTGAAMPVAEGDSRGGNAAIGGVAGGALPAAARAYRVGKAALVDPFTEAGKQRIVGGTLNRAAGDRERALANLLQRKAATPGVNLTAGQASGDAGIASLERAASAVDPGGFQSIKDDQIAALVRALRGVAGSPEARQAAIDAREQATEALYAQAKKAAVPGDAELAALLQRPTVAAGLKQAQGIAADEGRAFQLMKGKPASPVGVLDAQGNPIMGAATPDVYSGQGLHDLKMGIDKALTEGSQGIGNRIAGSQLTAKSDFLNWLESRIPEYGQARTTFADLSRPINQMDVGEELYKRFVPALADNGAVPFKSRADAYANALRNGDQLARSVIGMKGAKLENIMTPEQMAALQGVASDLRVLKGAESAGRGVGSDTVQKMAMSHLMNQAGVPNWMQSIGRVPGGWLRTLGDVLYTKNDDALRDTLAEVFKDPQAAAQAMQMAKTDPTRFMQAMQTLGQGTALSLPASVNATE